jgi:hypothetical protein
VLLDPVLHDLRPVPDLAEVAEIFSIMAVELGPTFRATLPIASA